MRSTPRRTAFLVRLSSIGFRHFPSRPHNRAPRPLSPKKRDGEKSPKVSFEESLEQLEAVVHDLEEGGLGLSDALLRYEEGIKHLRRCYRALRQAERKIELLAGLDAEGNATTEPFDDHDEATLEEKAATRDRRRSNSPRKPAPNAPEKQPPTDDMDGPPTLF